MEKQRRAVLHTVSVAHYKLLHKLVDCESVPVCVCAIATTPILPRRSVLRISCIFAFLVSIAGAFHIILVLKTGIEARPRYEVVRGIDMGGGKKAV